MAPAGTYMDVEVIVRLDNGTSRIYHWSTPLCLSRALHKAPRWAKDELKKGKVKGRSRIIGINVEVLTKYGSYRRS